MPQQRLRPDGHQHTLQENPVQWACDLARLRPELLKKLQEAVHTEVTNRTANEHFAGENTPAGFGILAPNHAAADQS